METTNAVYLNIFSYIKMRYKCLTCYSKIIYDKFSES